MSISSRLKTLRARSASRLMRGATARSSAQPLPASRSETPDSRVPPATEPLESRLLLSAAPVMVYNFDEGSGLTVHDTAPDASPNDGTLLDDGGVLPEFRSGDSPDGSPSYLHFGDESSGYASYVGGRVVTDQS